MPNWCCGHLDVTGPSSLVTSFLESASGLGAGGEESQFTFHKFIPRPEEENEGERWYDWNLANWGTKWDACHLAMPDNRPSPVEQIAVSCGEDPKISLTIRFDTAWSPPTPIIEHIVSLFPGLYFRYTFWIEGGFGTGVAVGENGNCGWCDYDESSEEGREITIEIGGYDPCEGQEEE